MIEYGYEEVKENQRNEEVDYLLLVMILKQHKLLDGILCLINGAIQILMVVITKVGIVFVINGITLTVPVS